MKIIKAEKGDRYTISASADELRMTGTALATFPAAPEERPLQRKLAQQVMAALPVIEEDDLEEDKPKLEKEDDDPDADLFEDEPAKANDLDAEWRK
jgi:hypothetical protein